MKKKFTTEYKVILFILYWNGGCCACGHDLGVLRSQWSFNLKINSYMDLVSQTKCSVCKIVSTVSPICVKLLCPSVTVHNIRQQDKHQAAGLTSGSWTNIRQQDLHQPTGLTPGNRTNTSQQDKHQPTGLTSGNRTNIRQQD